jgi:hypothetical protein
MMQFGFNVGCTTYHLARFDLAREIIDESLENLSMSLSLERSLLTLGSFLLCLSDRNISKGFAEDQTVSTSESPTGSPRTVIFSNVKVRCFSAHPGPKFLIVSMARENVQSSSDDGSSTWESVELPPASSAVVAISLLEDGDFGGVSAISTPEDDMLGGHKRQ